jgi:hypothetical protein
MESWAVRQNGVACVPWPEARCLLRHRRLEGTRLLLLAWTGSVLVPFWLIEMVVSAFRRVVRPLLADSDRSA